MGKQGFCFEVSFWLIYTVMVVSFRYKLLIKFLKWKISQILKIHRDHIYLILFWRKCKWTRYNGQYFKTSWISTAFGWIFNCSNINNNNNNKIFKVCFDLLLSWRHICCCIMFQLLLYYSSSVGSTLCYWIVEDFYMTYFGDLTKHLEYH